MKVIGQRQTRQKTLILETIRQTAAPLTAEQVLTCVRQVLPTLALTTVYRNLDQLTAQQTLSRMIYPDGVTRFKMADPHHHQLICLACSRTVDISQCPLECLSRQIEIDYGF